MRNQARVHLWFPGKFGEPYEPLTSSSEALERFVSPVFAVTVRLEADDRLMICAPFGLQDLFALINNIIFFGISGCLIIGMAVTAYRRSRKAKASQGRLG